MKYPVGKTPVKIYIEPRGQIRFDLNRPNIKKGDLGYIDGYVGNRYGFYAVFIREDGLMDLVEMTCIEVLFE